MATAEVGSRTTAACSEAVGVDLPDGSVVPMSLAEFTPPVPLLEDKYRKWRTWKKATRALMEAATELSGRGTSPTGPG